MGDVQTLAIKLLEELAVEKATSIPEPSERGGRLSGRQYIRDSDEPFLLPEEDWPAPPALALRLVIDHSTSMNHDGRIEHAAQAAMLLHLAAVESAIPRQIVVTPDDIRVADLDSGERGLALIASIIPAQTGCEDTGLAVFRHGASGRWNSVNCRVLPSLHS